MCAQRTTLLCGGGCRKRSTPSYHNLYLSDLQSLSLCHPAHLRRRRASLFHPSKFGAAMQQSSYYVLFPERRPLRRKFIISFSRGCRLHSSSSWLHNVLNKIALLYMILQLKGQKWYHIGDHLKKKKKILYILIDHYPAVQNRY